MRVRIGVDDILQGIAIGLQGIAIGVVVGVVAFALYVLHAHIAAPDVGPIRTMVQAESPTPTPAPAPSPDCSIERLTVTGGGWLIYRLTCPDVECMSFSFGGSGIHCNWGRRPLTPEDPTP